MTIFLIVISAGLLGFGFWNVKELPSISAASLLAGFILLGLAIGGGVSGDCYTDWDGRTNPTVCD